MLAGNLQEMRQLPTGETVDLLIHFTQHCSWDHNRGVHQISKLHVLLLTLQL
jgi:hypothetical protein